MNGMENQAEISGLNHKRRRYIGASILLTAFVVCFSPTFQWLHYKFQLPESYYSHGYLIPLVSMYLIYLKKAEISRLARNSTPLGLVILILSLLIHLLGVLSDTNFVSAFAMVFFLLGCSLYLMGIKSTRLILFPLFFLFFLCPMPDFILDPIALPLKYFATLFALKITNLIGIPYYREGFIIHLTNSTFLVGAPCNGMRSLISFLALGFLAVYFIRVSWWKTGLFLLSTIPLSIFLNGIRISILLYIANQYGQQAASPESYFHEASGLTVFVIGLVVMMIFMRWINEKRTV